MKKHSTLILLFFSFLFSLEADHIIFNKIVISPSEAELVSIYNPTQDAIDLSDYYLSDAEYSPVNANYYNLSTGSNYWSGFNSDFIAKFPEDTIIDSEETIIVALDAEENFNDYYGDYYSNLRVFYLQSDMLDALDGEDTIGSSANLSDNYEPLILFKWDGNSNPLIEDIDYFYWGDTEDPIPALSFYGIDKTGHLTYKDDTPFNIQAQNILDAHQFGEAYVRISNIEDGEKNPIDNPGFIGNGLTGHDETSEVFKDSWEIFSQSGCTIPEDPNYNPNAIVDDGSCLTGEITHTIQDIVTVPTTGFTDEDEYEATVLALIVDYDDVRPSNGPEVIVLEDNEGYRIDIVVWDWDVLSSGIGYMVTPGNLSDYVIIAKGTVGVYNGSYQFTIDSSDNIILYEVYHSGGEYIEKDIIGPSIDPAPFVIIPTLGEKLDYSFSFPSNSKVVVKIFDFNGNLITSLFEKYYQNSGTIERIEDNSEWDGRDHLGQIVAPGTYLMHIETTNILSGQSAYDVAPIVVGIY